MVKSNGLALWVLTAALASISTHQAATGRSLFGRRMKQADHMRVQAARLNRLEDRIEQMSTEAVFLAERSRQHREMRLKCSAELRDRLEEFKTKLQDQKETMQKDLEDKLATVREEVGAQAAADRDALEDELESRHAEERERLLEEAKERANNTLEEMKARMAAEAEKEREEYTERAQLAEEAKERACEDRDHLQAEKDQLARQLQETMEVEDASLKKIILKFKARENTLRKNFEAQLREERAAARGKVAPPEGGGASKRPRPVETQAQSTTTASGREASRRAAAKSSRGVSPNGSGVPSSSGAAPLGFSRGR